MLVITVCVGSSCYLKGAYEVTREFQRLIAEKGLEKQVELRAGFCMGHCRDAVTVRMGEETVTGVTPATVPQLLAEYLQLRD